MMGAQLNTAYLLFMYSLWSLWTISGNLHIKSDTGYLLPEKYSALLLLNTTFCQLQQKN